MEKPKDIAAGDWDTAFALCEQEFGKVPCDRWQVYLRRYQTVSEAFAGPGPHGDHGGSFGYVAGIGIQTTLDDWYMNWRATPGSVNRLIAYLRDRLLAK